MPVRTIRDVLGDPETWRNFVPVSGDAVIAEVIASEDYDRVVIETRNGSAYPTYSSFVIGDAETRKILIRFVRPGMTVEDALELEF
jgi:hypothetical protein